MAVYAKTCNPDYTVGRAKKVKELNDIELQYRHFLSQSGEEGVRQQCFSSTYSTTDIPTTDTLSAPLRLFS